MPNFIIDCPQDIIHRRKHIKMMQAVSEAAEATGLFDVKNIKVRIRPYEYYLVAHQQQDFMHVFGYIRAGRTDEQKRALSHKIVATLEQLFPEILVISMDVTEFDPACYVNSTMLK